MARYCTILHISDPHFGTQHAYSTHYDRVDALKDSDPTLYHALTAHLNRLLLSGEIEPPDLLAITGDFIWRDASTTADDVNNRFGLALNFVERLFEFMVGAWNAHKPGATFTRESVLLIPGNHDVKRGNSLEDDLGEYFTNLIVPFYRKAESDQRIRMGLECVDTPGLLSNGIIVSARSPDGNAILVGADTNNLQNPKVLEEFKRLEEVARIAGKKGPPLAGARPGFVDIQKLSKRLISLRKDNPEVMMGLALHHPLAVDPNYPHMHELDCRPILNAPRIYELVRDLNIAFTLHGHKHSSAAFAVDCRSRDLSSEWLVPHIASGSACRSEDERTCTPSFNLVKVRVPPPCRDHSITVQFNTDQNKKFTSSLPVSVRCTATNHGHVRPLVGADMRLFEEIGFMKALRDVTISFKRTVTDYVDRLLDATASLGGSIWMTCCFTPSFFRALPDEGGAGRALAAFMNAARAGRDVRRAFVLSPNRYRELVAQQDDLAFFWENAVGKDSNLKVFCTRADWYNDIGSIVDRSVDVDFVSFSPTLDSTAPTVLRAFAADQEESPDAHLIDARIGEDKVADDLRHFFSPRPQSPHGQRLVPCPTPQLLVERVKKFIIPGKIPSERESISMWKEIT